MGSNCGGLPRGGLRIVDHSELVDVLQSYFPTLSGIELEHALRGFSALYPSIEAILRDPGGSFFEEVATSLIAHSSSVPLGVSLPGLAALIGDLVPENAFTTRPRNVLRRLTSGSRCRWSEISTRSPNDLLALMNLGSRSAAEIIRVAAHTSVAQLSTGGFVHGSELHEQVLHERRQSSVASPLKYALGTLGAWMEIAYGATSLGTGFLQLAAHGEVLPDEVARACSILSEAPVSLIADPGRLDTLALLQSLEEALGDEVVGIVFWARIKVYAKTLDALSESLGLTRERVRQIQVKAESCARDVLERNQFAPLRWRAVLLGRQLGIGFPDGAAWARARLNQATVSVGDEWRERFSDLLMWIAGPFRADHGWVVRGELPNRSAVTSAIDDTGRVDLEKVEAVLRNVGLDPESLGDWCDLNLPVHTIGDDVFLWEGSVADKAQIVLGAWGRPASTEEIVQAIGEDHAIRATRGRLLADERFKRVDRVRIGLRDWSHDEYTGIVDELAQELASRGGVSDIRDLVIAVANKYDLRVSSVDAYTSVPRFVRSGSRIRLRRSDEPYAPLRNLTDEPRCYIVREDECTYRMPIDQEVMRGSGRPIPEGLGSWLGVFPRMRREFLFGQETVSISWPDSALLGPSIGSIRSTVLSLGGRVGDQCLLLFNRERGTGAASIVRETDLTGSQRERVLILTGMHSEGELIESMAGAIGAPVSEVKERLRKRGELDLLELVSREDDHLDTALDRLRKVL